MVLQGNYESKNLIIFLSVKSRFIEDSEMVVPGDDTPHKITVLEGFHFRCAEFPIYLAGTFAVNTETSNNLLCICHTSTVQRLCLDSMAVSTNMNI